MAKVQGKTGMLLSIAAVVVAIAIAVVVLSARSTYLAWDRGKVGTPRLLNETTIGTNDLPALVAALSRGSAPIRYAALMLNTPDRPSDDDAVALQISFENGTVGFDWVLLAPRNIEDQEKFKAFARSHGLVAAAKSENGVSYLRVECPDAAQFATSVVTDMYHLPPNEPLALVHEGFDWPQS